MKRLIAGTAAGLLAAVLFLPVSAGAVSARCAAVLDPVSGRLLYEKNPDSRSLIASTTKIMTALLICEQCCVLARMEIPKEAAGVEGSSMYLKAGEVLTIQELLYGLMLCSGNDAAVALAIYCGGTVEGFVEQMNDKARLLKLENTHFENPNGLDAPGHYSTARDLARLAAYAMENPVFAQTVSTRTCSAAGRQLRNHNKLLWLFPGADGVKTGFTRRAGRTLVSSACRDGRRLIAVTLDDGNDWRDHQVLLEQGFSDFHLQRIVTAGDSAGSRAVLGGRADRVNLVVGEHFVYALASEEPVALVLPQPEFVYAPVTEGASAGFAYVTVSGKAVGKVPVYYGETVEQQEETRGGFWSRLRGG